MKSQSLIKLFFLILGSMLLSIYFVVSAGDPNRVFLMPWMVKTKTHFNFAFHKYELLNNNLNDYEALLLGSSTSEAYLTVNVEKLINQKTFQGSVAGSQTMGRLSLADSAMSHSKNLKTIIYISDFFEFNKSSSGFIDPLVVLNPVLSENIPDVIRSEATVDLTTRFWQIFSHLNFERSISQIRKKITGIERPHYSKKGDLYDNRNVMGIVYDKDYLENLKVVAQEAKDKSLSGDLANEVTRSILEYTSGSLATVSYSEKTEEMYKELVQKASNKGIKIIFILSPYHPQFLQKVIRERGLEQPYNRWRSFLSDLNDNNNVVVLDATNPTRYFPQDSPYWRDGVHYSVESATVLLQNALTSPRD